MRSKYIDSTMYKRLKSFEHGKLMGPHTIFLFVTTKCPLKCKFCGRSIYLGLKRGYDKEITDFVSLILFGPKYHLMYKVREKTRLGLKVLRNTLEGNSDVVDTLSEIDKLIDNSLPVNFSYAKRIKSIVSRLPLKYRITFAAYIALKIRDKFARDMEFRMPLDTYLRVVNEAAELGVKRMYISGNIGDPLTDKPFLYRIMREVSRYDIEGIVTTNGYLADQQFAEHLVNIRWKGIILSIDGAREETHDSLRSVKGSFERVIRFLRTLTKIKERMGTPYPHIYVNFVITRINYMEIIAHLELMAELGVESITYSPMMVHTYRAMNDLKMREVDEGRFRDILKKERAKLNKLNVSHNLFDFLEETTTYGYTALTHPDKDKFWNEILRDMYLYLGNNVGTMLNNYSLERVMCSEPWLSMVIDANGCVKRCCFPTIPLINMNVMEHSLEDIWYSSRYNKLRNMFMAGKMPAECRYNCLPTVMSMQSKLINEYRRLRDIDENTVGVPEYIAQPLRHIDDITYHMSHGKISLHRILELFGYNIYTDQ